MRTLIYVGIIFTLIAIFIPVGIYIIRNIMRYGFKKVYFWLEKMLRWSWLVGFIVFLIGIIFIIIDIAIV